jgi:hypothetical protein
MIHMKMRTAVAVALGGWVAALGSAALLTYDLNRPLHSGPHIAEVTLPSEPLPDDLVEPAAEPEPVLYMPTVTIVGQPRHASAPGGARGVE